MGLDLGVLRLGNGEVQEGIDRHGEEEAPAAAGVEQAQGRALMQRVRAGVEREQGKSQREGGGKIGGDVFEAAVTAVAEKERDDGEQQADEDVAQRGVDVAAEVVLEGDVEDQGEDIYSRHRSACE